MTIYQAAVAAYRAAHYHDECTIIWRSGDSSRFYAVSIGDLTVLASVARCMDFEIPRMWWELTLEDYFATDWDWATFCQEDVHVQLEMPPEIVDVKVPSYRGEISLYPARSVRRRESRRARGMNGQRR